MTILLWYTFWIAIFTFNLLIYILVIYIHDEHTELYKELGEPSAFHFLVNSASSSQKVFTVFIFKCQYRSKLKAFHGLFKLSQWILSMLITAIASALLLVVSYA
jgi:hypothetical protein